MNKTASFMFIELLENAGYETRSYSGRGMYGKSCVGVTLERSDSLGVFIADVMSELYNQSEEDRHNIQIVVEKAFRRMATDQMGTGTIVYFINMPFEEKEEDNVED